MGKFQDFVNGSNLLGGESFLRLTFSAAGLVTDQFSNDVGTTSTSGVYMMQTPGCIHAISALADAGAIIYLPAAAEFPLGICFITATTGSAGGDVSVYDRETAAEISTYGDMDADDDHAAFISRGTGWVLLFDGVA